MDLTNEAVDTISTQAEQVPATPRVIKYVQRRPNGFQADEGYFSLPSSVRDDHVLIQSSVRDDHVLIQSPVQVNREVNYELEHAQIQEMRRKWLSARHYQRVAVLIVSWEEDVDNPDAKSEVTSSFWSSMLPRIGLSYTCLF